MGTEGLFHSHDNCDSNHAEMAYSSLRTSDGIKVNTEKGDPRFKALLDQMWEMHCRKANDYGSDEDFLANLRASEDYGVPAWIGALIRANDKMVRLENAAKGTNLANESVEDSLMDLACYAVLSLILYKETLPSQEELKDNYYHYLDRRLRGLNER